MYQQGDFGTFIPQPTKVARRKVNPAGIVGCLFVPFLIFAAVYYLGAFSMQYEYPGVTTVLKCCFLLPVAAFAGMTVTAARKGTSDPRILGFLFCTSLLAWAMAATMANVDFIKNNSPYYDLTNLNTYPSVNPSIYRGQQLMDAGVVHFTRGSHLNLSLSVGFKNKDVYCVAPIVGGEETAGAAKTRMDHYDFWAVGINCCSGHIPDFHCGEYTNPLAQSGLRLMRDDQRQFFRLAVKEAEAMFNLKADHPVFMYWMAEPQLEVEAYKDEGYKQFYQDIFAFFAIQFFLVIVLVLVLTRT